MIARQLLASRASRNNLHRVTFVGAACVRMIAITSIGNIVGFINRRIPPNYVLHAPVVTTRFF
jgi:hypothetical protein